MSGSRVRQHWNSTYCTALAHICQKLIFPHCRAFYFLSSRDATCDIGNGFRFFSALETRSMFRVSVSSRPSGNCLIAKRYVCAANSFEEALSTIVAQLACSLNVTRVRPAGFRQSRLVSTRPSGPVEGRETLHTHNGFWVFAMFARNAFLLYTNKPMKYQIVHC